MQPFEILLYAAPEGKATIEVYFEDETFWFSQKKMGDLFSVDVRTISEHLQNVFKSNELFENSVIRKFRITADDGKSYLTNLYNLDAIIAVGYRVNSIESDSAKTTSTNYSNVSAKSEPANADSIKRLPTSTPNAVPTMTPSLQSPKHFTKRSKTNCTGPSPVTPPQNWSPNGQTPFNPTWDWLLGKTPPKERFYDPIYPSQKITSQKRR